MYAREENSPKNSVIGLTRSPMMQDIGRVIDRVAQSDLGVLIIGENGSGMEWTARRIHHLSNRAENPFRVIDCGTLTPSDLEREIFGYEALARRGIKINLGAFEEADGGTVFFDEISQLPEALQSKIARVIDHRLSRRLGGGQEMPVSVRIIAGLSRKADVMEDNDNLKRDRYYRISPIIIELPPLRERREDISLLIEEFISQSNARLGNAIKSISPEALRLCLEYEWPGNIRQLKNSIEYATLMCHTDEIQREHLPVYVQRNESQSRHGIMLHKNMSVASVEKLLIDRALSESPTKKQAAALLGISLKTLYNKLNRYKLYHKFVDNSRAGMNEKMPVHEDEAKKLRRL